MGDYSLRLHLFCFFVCFFLHSRKVCSLVLLWRSLSCLQGATAQSAFLKMCSFYAVLRCCIWEGKSAKGLSVSPQFILNHNKRQI